MLKKGSGLKDKNETLSHNERRKSQFARMAGRISSVGFLGSGKMATAMARGFIAAGNHRAQLHLCIVIVAKLTC